MVLHCHLVAIFTSYKSNQGQKEIKRIKYIYFYWIILENAFLSLYKCFYLYMFKVQKVYL